MQPGQSNTIWTNSIARSVAHQTVRAAAPAPASLPQLHPLLRHVFGPTYHQGEDIAKTFIPNKLRSTGILCTACFRQGGKGRALRLLRDADAPPCWHFRL